MTLYTHPNMSLFSGWRFLGVLLILASAFVISTPLLFSISYNLKVFLLGSIAFTLGILLSTSYEGLQLDLKQKKQRNFISILGIKKGTWESIDAITTLVLSSHSGFAQNAPNGISPTLSGTVTLYKVAAYANKESIFALWFHKKEKARHLGNMISDHLNAPLHVRVG